MEIIKLQKDRHTGIQDRALAVQLHVLLDLLANESKSPMDGAMSRHGVQLQQPPPLGLRSASGNPRRRIERV